MDFSLKHRGPTDVGKNTIVKQGGCYNIMIRSTKLTPISLLAGLLLLTSSLFAESGQEIPDSAQVQMLEDTIRVVGRHRDLTGIASSASEVRVSYEDFRLRPLLREAELLETSPGFIATQHSGGGKGNQMFLRGFNLDHGTDFSTSVEGMPINLPTHAHGHGYTDIHFLIPEFVSDIEFHKGVYSADIGDFSSAGSARINLRKRTNGNLLKFEVGEDGYRRAVAGISQKVGASDLLIAAEMKGHDGPWDVPENLKKTGVMARFSTPDEGRDRFSFLFLGYDNEWAASDQIPRRAVESGLISPYGQIDSTLGGESSRYSLSGTWDRYMGNTSLQTNFYLVKYEMDLFSNFTYFAADSVTGDQFEQYDNRTIIGGGSGITTVMQAFGHEQAIRAGVQVRADFIQDLGLYSTEERRRVSTIREDGVTQLTTGAYFGVSSHWSDKVRTEIGLRGDLFYFDVDARSLAQNGGSETDGILSPKFSVAVGPFSGVEFYGNAGLGFHSNDARGATIAVDPTTGDPTDKVDALVRSTGAEVGVRVSPVNNLQSTVALWWLELDSELLFVGDGGATEPSDKSRRTGIEFANAFNFSRQLFFDLDLALTRSRLKDVGDEDRIPGALESVLSAGVTWDHPSGLAGAVRVRYFGEYALIEDNSQRAEPSTMVNTMLSYRFQDITLAVSVLNLFDEEDNDIQYYYGSKLGAEVGETEDIHYHPALPRSVRISLCYGI